MEMDKATTALHLIIESGFRLGIWIAFLCIQTIDGILFSINEDMDLEEIVKDAHRWLDKLTPVIRHIDEDELWMYRYPSVDSYVPKRYLYTLMIVVPITIYITQWIIYRKDRTTIPDLVSSAYGLTLAYCLNGIVTAALKLCVGRPRPNFYFRCFPEGYGTDIDNCDGEYHGQMDGRKSFPSAHSSFIFTCVIYMILHLNDRLELRKPRFLKGIIITSISMLLLSAILISASRTADYHHHYSDVIGGALIGIVIGTVLQTTYATKDETFQNNIMKVILREK